MLPGFTIAVNDVAFPEMLPALSAGFNLVPTKRAIMFYLDLSLD